MAQALMANHKPKHIFPVAVGATWDSQGSRRLCCRQVRELVGLTLEESGAEPSELYHIEKQPARADPSERCDTTWCATQAFYATTNSTNFLPTPTRPRIK